MGRNVQGYATRYTRRRKWGLYEANVWVAGTEKHGKRQREEILMK